MNSEIKTKIRIVKENETTCKRGAEYCIEFYSETNGNYLRNIGYIGEQIDLYLAEIWKGEVLPFSNIVRFAPSACNTQPWIVESNGLELNVYRYKKPGKRGIMPAEKVRFYNRIDMGVFMFFLEVCLEHEGYAVNSTQIFEDEPDEVEKVLVAKYTL